MVKSALHAAIGLAAMSSIALAEDLSSATAGPLIVSLEKRGVVDGKPLRLFFTDVAVKQVGSDDWLNAE